MRIPEEVVFQNVGEETILLNMKTGLYYALNPVGSRVLDLMVEKKYLPAVLESMLSEYEVAPEDLQRDILSLVQEMRAEGLIAFA